MKDIAIRYGVIAAAIFVTWTLAEHVLGFNTTRLQAGEVTRMISAFVFYFMIFLCLRARKKSVAGPFTYIDGLKTGTIMVLVYSAITAVWLVIYQHLINPQMHELMVNYTREKMSAAGAGQEDVTKAVEEVDMIYSGKPYSFIMYFIFSSVMGVFVVALLSLFVKRKKSTYEV